MPTCFCMSALHLFVGRPAVLNPFLGRQSVHLFVHLLSVYLAMCPAQFHFCVNACLRTSVTQVFCPIVVHGTLSWSFMPSIFLSIDLWVVCNFEESSLVSDHVWQPYVIIGKMLWLNTFFFRVIGKSLSWKMSLYFPKANHAFLMRIAISSFVLFSKTVFCPRYL